MPEQQSEFVQRVVSLFRDYNYSRRQNIPDDKLIWILNQRSLIQFGRSFKVQLMNQLIEGCLDQFYGLLSPLNFAQTVEEAKKVLEDRIEMLRKDNGVIRDRQSVVELKKVEKKQLQLRSPSKTMKMNIEQLQFQIDQLNKSISEFKSDLLIFNEELMIINAIFTEYEPKQKIHDNHQEKMNTPSLSLALAAYFSFFGLLLQTVFILNLRMSMFSILLYLHILYLLFVGYFHRKAGMLLIFQNILIYYIIRYFYEAIQPQFRHTSNLLVIDQESKNTIVLVQQILLGLTIIIRILLLFWTFSLRYMTFSHKSSPKIKPSSASTKHQINYQDIKKVVKDQNTNQEYPKHYDYIKENQYDLESIQNCRKFKFMCHLFYLKGKVKIRQEKFILC